MDISFLGHSSFRLKGSKATVLCDPFDPEMVGLSYKKVDADIVTISHSHKDHSFIEGAGSVGMVIEGPGEYEVSGVSIVGIASYHDDNKGAERGENTIFVIEIDGLRIAHLGDLGHVLSEKQLEEIGSVDVLIIPVGGEYTVGSTQAAAINRSIEPYITIPMHYFTEGMNNEIFGKLSKVDDFLREAGLTVEKKEKLSLKRSELTEDSKVVVLERK